MKTTVSLPFSLPVPTTSGEFLAFYSNKGLAELRFPGDKGSANLVSEGAVPAQIRHWHQLTIAAVHSILEGQAPEALPPLDLAAGSNFQRNVWAQLLKLAPGQTLSYGELALRVGTPSGARAVGTACGANPIPLIIPCHRILTADGRLGGFSGGLDWKRRLLKREGVQPREREIVRSQRHASFQSRLSQEQLAYF